MKEPPRMSDGDLKKFVLGFCDGHVFTDRHLRKLDPKILRLVFMPFALADLPDIDPEKLGLVWEWRDKATPRAINGYPTFLSVRMMHVDDWERARAAIKKELEHRENLKV